MVSKFRLILGMMVMLGLGAGITACHTTAGFGQDMSQGGHALTNSADQNAPKSPGT